MLTSHAFKHLVLWVVEVIGIWHCRSAFTIVNPIGKKKNIACHFGALLEEGDFLAAYRFEDLLSKCYTEEEVLFKLTVMSDIRQTREWRDWWSNQIHCIEKTARPALSFQEIHSGLVGRRSHHVVKLLFVPWVMMMEGLMHQDGVIMNEMLTEWLEAPSFTQSMHSWLLCMHH